jgi:lysophospholipase L1-like esterase
MNRIALRTLESLKAGKRRTIVTYGCSLTANGAWVKHLAERLDSLYEGRARVINTAKSTECSRWGLEHVQQRVVAHDPDLVFLEFSMNDAFEEYAVSLEEARSNLESIIDTIRTHNPECEFVLMVMNAIEGKSAGYRPRLEEYNQVYRDVAGRRGLPLIDHYPAWLALRENDHDAFARYVPDGLHPSPEGARHIITPALFEALGLD